MSVVLKEVRTGRDLKRFIHFPFTLYKDSPYWVPPLIQDELNTLRKEKNPAFAHCEAKYVLAYRDGKIVGRIAMLINWKFIEKWKKKYARFGWIDFIDDREVSKALIEYAEHWARERGMEGIHGPMGFTDLDREGMLIEGFEELGTLPMIYNYPYYPEHLGALGYKKDVDWLEFEIKTPTEINEKVLRVQDLVLKRSGLRLVEARKPKDLKPYAHQIFDVINEAYSDLYGVVELTEPQINAYVKQYFGFIQTDYTKVIVDKDDRMVAFGIAMPSLSQACRRAKGRLFPFGFIHFLHALHHPKQIDMYLVAVRPKYQGMGVNAILMTEITRSGIRNGITSAETSGELENNKAVQDLWKYYDKRRHKRRRCFIKPLS
jgi:GNAT superfamily N-acetyltransferase